MSLKLEVHLCADRRSIFVTFASDEVAAKYIKANSHRFAVFADEETPGVLDDYPLTMEALFPQCEHGLSAQLCHGPGHYPSMEWELAHYGA